MNHRCKIRADRLKCEGIENPIGIDVQRPRLTWLIESAGGGERGLMQSAYQIVVGSGKEAPGSGAEGDWDSGKIEGPGTEYVLEIDRPFAGGERCWWKVRVWDQSGEVSDYSDAAHFEYGLLGESDWQGSWIGAEPSISAPLLRKSFEVTGPVESGRAYIVGLGYHELYVNGQKVGDHVLDPAPTYYSDLQSLGLRSRAFYVTHDITEYFVAGENVVGVMLGHGWYSLEPDIPNAPDHYAPFGDRPKLLLQLNITNEDGTTIGVATDTTWKVSDGPIRYNDYSNGETYDARLEKPGWNSAGYDDDSWKPAQQLEAPDGELEAQMIPPEKVVETIAPVGVSETAAGSYIFDFGVCITGWIRLRVSGEQGTEVAFSHAQVLLEDGTLDTRSHMTEFSPVRQTDTYVLKGDGKEKWEPRFTMHGFRYVEVKGFPGTATAGNIDARVVRTALPASGRFSCSNPLLNTIHDNVCRTFAGSFHGIPQDASERGERVAWLGDPGFVAEDYMYTFETEAFWSKWLRDIRDAQLPNGDLPFTCPVYWRGTDLDFYTFWATWKSTYPLFAWFVYQYYGSTRVLEDHYEGLKAFIEFLISKSDGYVIEEGLGDHMEPQEYKSHFTPLHTPPGVTSTAYLYFDTWIVSQAAKILGKDDDAVHYKGIAGRIRNAFNNRFLDPAKNSYATGSQTANALALYLGLVPQVRETRVLENLVQDILVGHLGHLSTGIIGTNALQQALPKYGRADVMYEIANKVTFPGWGYQVMRGATTVWETWDGNPDCCWNMKMFCGIEKFLLGNLGGITPDKPGYEQIGVRPCVVGDLDHVNAEVDTPRGTVQASWRREDERFVLQVTIPPNAQSLIGVPTLSFSAPEISENGKVVWANGEPRLPDEIRGVKEENGVVTFECGSGSYEFTVIDGLGKE